MRMWWRGEDSNLRSRTTADLQSAPFGRSGTPPDGGRFASSHPFALLAFNYARAPTRCHSVGIGAGGGTRTRDLLITSQVLYRLSYASEISTQLRVPTTASWEHRVYAHQSLSVNRKSGENPPRRIPSGTRRSRPTVARHLIICGPPTAARPTKGASRPRSEAVPGSQGQRQAGHRSESGAASRRRASRRRATAASR